MRPNTPWVVQSLFDMQARAGQWLRAQETLQDALRNKVVPVERGRTLKAILLVERSRQAEARGNMAEATQFAREAFLTEPSRIPVAQRYGERLIAENDYKRVRKNLDPRLGAAAASRSGAALSGRLRQHRSAQARAGIAGADGRAAGRYRNASGAGARSAGSAAVGRGAAPSGGGGRRQSAGPRLPR